MRFVFFFNTLKCDLGDNAMRLKYFQIHPKKGPSLSLTGGVCFRSKWDLNWRSDSQESYKPKGWCEKQSGAMTTAERPGEIYFTPMWHHYILLGKRSLEWHKKRIAEPEIDGRRRLQDVMNSELKLNSICKEIGLNDFEEGRDEYKPWNIWQ